MTYKQHTIISHLSGGWEVWEEGANRFIFCEALFPRPQSPHCTCSWRNGSREGSWTLAPFKATVNTWFTQNASENPWLTVSPISTNYVTLIFFIASRILTYIYRSEIFWAQVVISPPYSGLTQRYCGHMWKPFLIR